MGRILLTLAFALPLAAASAPSLLDILSDELQRNFTILKQNGDPPPYYMGYTVTDEESQSLSATLGAMSPATRDISVISISRCASARLVGQLPFGQRAEGAASRVAKCCRWTTCPMPYGAKCGWTRIERTGWLRAA